MEINWTQIILSGISTGVGACFGTISTFIVMRYFPKMWGKMEMVIKSGLETPKQPRQKRIVDNVKVLP